MKIEKELIKKSLIIGCIWLIPSLLFDYLGINIYHLWDNSGSLLPELWNIPIGNIPFSIFGAAFFILLWNTLNKMDKPERTVIKVFVLLMAAGTCGYVVALMIQRGFLIHYTPYNLTWAYFFWLGNLLIMVGCDFLYDKCNLKK